MNKTNRLYLLETKVARLEEETRTLRASLRLKAEKPTPVTTTETWINRVQAAIDPAGTLDPFGDMQVFGAALIHLLSDNATGSKPPRPACIESAHYWEVLTAQKETFTGPAQIAQRLQCQLCGATQAIPDA
ncbi:hypothetical protein [Mycetocola spongiae]|uniref:hypothetical protein n=1 Tax=Mycetocola spongiae TaxID=2859226 RepID=UPI001CF53D50|nr:hypothetical protein [Mycetocola spongiae]UCR89260.1 hypothetical protein KXZ72_00660 [Mycetocola spongiae]